MLDDGTRVTFSASRARISHSVNRLLLLEIVVAFVALALAALVLRRVTARTLRPLTEISEVATRIADGQTSRLDPERTDTELGRLATAFDRMVESLEIAAAQARSSEAAMRQFLADASHELRTPAAALQASAETLLREQPERPERDRIEARLARDASRLGRLVDDLLNLARIEGGPAPVPSVVDLAAVTRASVTESTGDSGSVEVATALTRKTLVAGDAAALSRALRNLVDNALTAAGPSGRVSVSVRSSNGGALAQVVDDGPGIPDDQRDRVFQRFVRLDASRPGSGLGLAIAREIARRYGGDVTCDDAERGASFTLRLPLVPVSDHPRAEPVDLGLWC